MKNVYGRKFNLDTDFNKLQLFLTEMRSSYSQGGFFHLGDLIYRIYKRSNGFDIEKDIRIWEESGRISGFVLYLTHDNNPEFQIRPDLYNSEISQEMVKWAINRGKELKHNCIEVSCIDTDLDKKKFLISNNFSFFNDPIVFMEIDLDRLPDYKLPENYSFKTVNDLPEKIELTGEEEVKDDHGDLFNSKYYKDDLGIRLCNSDQEIVSGCICWFDETDKSGLFEPVGTHIEHRTKGLAYCAMAKTLKNLKSYGATKAYVRTGGDNNPAIGLYKKLGFSIANYDHGYELEL